MKVRRTAIIATAATFALITVLGPAQGTDTAAAAPSTYVPTGVLSLSTGSVDRIALDTNVDGTPEKTQALTEAADCLLGTDESLLAIDGFVGTSTTDLASFRYNSIGVAEKKTGTSCYQAAAPAEKLILKLNPANVRGDLGPLLASSAFLDMELKGGAQVLATAKRDGQVVGYYELRSGTSVKYPVALPGGVTATAVHNCTTSSDSGPDSGDCDNCRWPISTPTWLGADDAIYFDTLELQAVKGTFSLEGGSDYGSRSKLPVLPANYPATNTIFELVTVADGVVACDASTPTLDGTETKPTVTVRRLDNADPAETCAGVPFTLTNLDSAARFLKPSNTQGTAQFVFDLVWTVPLAAMPLPVTEVDFETADPRTGIPLGWCPDPVYETGGTLVGISDPLNNAAAVDMDDVLAGKQFACVGTQSAQVVAGDPDTVTVTEQVYVLGDVYLRK